MPTTPPIKVPIVGVDKYTKQFNKLNKKISRIGAGIAMAGRKMTTGLTLPIAAAGVASVKFARDLNKGMANVATLIPNETERIKKLKEQVLDLSVATGTSSTIIAEGLYETISAFGGAEDPINKLTIATRMSRAGLSTVKEALSLVSAVTKGYGDTSDAAAQKASDLAFMTVKLGQTTFPDLAASMGRVIPLAAALGVSQEELFGAMATLTGVTGNAAEASTQLRSILGSAAKPSDDLTKSAKKLGYASGAAMISELGLEGTMQKVADITGKQVDQVGKLITRKEGLVAALALTGGQADKFTEKVEAMKHVTGATDEAFKQQTEGIDKAGFKWDQFVRRVQRAAIRIGDRLLPVVERIIIKLEPFFDWISSLSGESLEFGLKIAGLVAALGPFLMIVGTATKAVAAFRAILGLTRVTALAGFFGPLGRTATAFGSVATEATKATAAMDGAAGAAGRFGKAGRLLKGAGRFLGKAGAVGAAAGVGVAIGETLNQAVFDEQNQKYSDLQHKADLFSAADARTSEQIKAAMAKAEMLKKKLIEDRYTTENVMGNFAALFTDVESPAERLQRTIMELTIEQTKLAKKFKETKYDVNMEGGMYKDLKAEGLNTEQKLVKEINLNAKSQADINIDFANVPQGVNPKVKTSNKKGKINVQSKGAVMEGNL